MFNPKGLLHIEGVALFAAALVLYAHLRGDALLFVLLLFVPDVAMVGYLRDVRLGSALYNLAHNLVLPLLLALAALAAGEMLPLLLALIWLAHIGMDRAVGYGLKYPTAFKDTHLQRV